MKKKITVEVPANVRSILERKQGGPCAICNEAHPIQNRCRYEALAAKITKLTEANSFIPQILQANKEATSLAIHYQGLLKKADEAHAILMEILEKHGETGEQIKLEYLERLDKWASKSINQDTQEQLNLFSPGDLTPNEKSDKPSIILESGGSSPKNS